MTGRKRGISRVSLLLIMAMMVSFMGIFSEALPGGIGSGTMLSTATIKTQKAANSLFKKGAVRGIDVSKYQGEINWKKVAGDDVDFVFVRASYGTTKDPYFIKNCQGANKYGLKVGAYHFATFTTKSQMKKEAKYFISRLKKVDITYPVVLDLEGQSQKSLSTSALTNLAIQFMELVEAEGYTVMLYTGYNYAKANLNLNKLQDYDLWIANYLTQPKDIDHAIWQYASNGSVKGINGDVDINVAYKDMSVKKRRSSSSSSSSSTSSISDSASPSSSPTGGSANSSGSSSSRSSSSGSSGSKKEIGESILATMNDRYATRLTTNSSNLEIATAISKGLQYEIVHQYGEQLELTGVLTREQVYTIASGGFKKNTESKITYLIQARLFFRGYYKQYPTSLYDNNTITAMKNFQDAKGLEVTGSPDAQTLLKLLL